MLRTLQVRKMNCIYCPGVEHPLDRAANGWEPSGFGGQHIAATKGIPAGPGGNLKARTFRVFGPGGAGACSQGREALGEVRARESKAPRGAISNVDVAPCGASDGRRDRGPGPYGPGYTTVPLRGKPQRGFTRAVCVTPAA